MTVACVWVRGNVPYDIDYVRNLAGMVKRHLSCPHRFVVLTDSPCRVPTGIEPIKVPSPGGMPGWWSKVELFQPNRFTGRVLYLDLDTLVVAPLDPIVQVASSFALIPHSGSFEGNGKRQIVKRFNSSVMVWDAGVTDRLFTDWDYAVTKRLHGDQDWIGEQMPEATAMPLSWFPRISELNGEPPSKAAKVVLVKTPKNEKAAAKWPWFAAAWRAA